MNGFAQWVVLENIWPFVRMSFLSGSLLGFWPQLMALQKINNRNLKKEFFQHEYYSNSSIEWRVHQTQSWHNNEMMAGIPRQFCITVCHQNIKKIRKLFPQKSFISWIPEITLELTKIFPNLLQTFKKGKAPFIHNTEALNTLKGDNC